MRNLSFFVVLSSLIAIATGRPGIAATATPHQPRTSPDLEAPAPGGREAARSYYNLIWEMPFRECVWQAALGNAHAHFCLA